MCVNKLFIMFMFIFMVSCYADSNNNHYDENFIKQNIMEYDPEVTFNSIFSEYKDYFDLTNDELNLVGMWEVFDPDIEDFNNTCITDFIFFPNHLAVVVFEGFNVDEELQYMELVGEWFFDSEWVKIKFHSYINLNLLNRKKVYNKIKEYVVKVCRIENIDEKGFTRKRFNKIKLPDEVLEFIKKDNKQIQVHRVRLLYLLNIGKDSPSPPLQFQTYFQYIPDMVKRNLSGKEIANNLELLKEFFE